MITNKVSPTVPQYANQHMETSYSEDVCLCECVYMCRLVSIFNLAEGMILKSLKNHQLRNRKP